MIVADIKDFVLVSPNELLFFSCPQINNHLEGVITIRFKTGETIQFPLQLVFYSLDKNPPANINLCLPKGYTINKRLNISLFQKILNIFLELKREKEKGTTFLNKLKELAEYHKINADTLLTIFLGVFPN